MNSAKLKSKVIIVFIVGFLLLAYLTKINTYPLILAFVLGCISSCTPCVFPLIPILIKQLQTGNKIQQLCSYIFGVATANCLIGLSIVLLKKNFVDFFQSSIITYAFALILIYISVNDRDIVKLVVLNSKKIVPSFSKTTNMQHKIINIGTLIKCDTKLIRQYLPKSFFMGLTSALVLSPCTTGALAAAVDLGINANSWQAIIIMLLFGLGSSCLLVTCGFGMLSLKPGAWMEIMKSIINVIIFALGIKLILAKLALPDIYLATIVVAFAVEQALFKFKKHPNSLQA